MTALDVSILFVGQAEHRELHAVHAALSAAARSYRHVPNVDAAVASLQRGRWVPDVVLVAPLWPGDFGSDDVARLLRRCPLARVIWCLGAWCQGGGRGAVRGLAHVCIAHPSAVLRILDDLVLLGRATLPPVALPPTASAEEQLERALQTASMARPAWCRPPSDDLTGASSSASSPTGAALQTVGVASADPEFASILAQTCQQRTGRVIVAPFDTLRRMPADRLVWDTTPWSERRIDQLRAYRAAQPGVPVLAITDFPRHSICAALLQSGASTILTKPLLVTDLLRRLDQPKGALEAPLQQ